MTPRAIRLASFAMTLCLAVALSPPGFASTLTWVGDAGTGWFDNISGNTNWSGDLLPTTGDDLVFTSAGTYGGTLSLGGQTIALNSITVGQAGDTAEGGLSDFGVINRVLASNGTVQLGGGGLTATMVGATVANERRAVEFETDFVLTADTFIERNTNYGGGSRNRQLVIDGDISGGTAGSPIDFRFESKGYGSGNRALSLTGDNNMVGSLALGGALAFSGNPFGDAANPVAIGTSPYLHLYAPGVLTTSNPVTLGASTVLLGRYSGSDWILAGDLTGGSPTARFELLSNGGRRFIFAGADQSFANWVGIRAGSKAVIAAADASGVAWPNANYVMLNYASLTSGTTDLLLRGDFQLNQNIVVRNISTSVPTRVGQVNDGAAAYDAAFDGRIDCQEPDFQVLRLTADAGGSATFNDQIRVAGGNAGFDKTGAGTVVINHRVSENFTNTNPIGPVNVNEGTLLVNSPDANRFYTTGIAVADGATLGGTGTIDGSVLLNGASAALAPGAGGIDTLTVDGDVVFGPGGIFDVEVGATTADLLRCTGLLDLTDAALLVSRIEPQEQQVYIIAEYGTLAGTFAERLPVPYTVDYHYMGENQIALIIPEPMSLTLLGLGALALVRRRRKHSRP